MYLSFNELKINDTFIFDGTIFRKQSSRTAHVNGMPHRWFYFSKKDICRYPTKIEYKTNKL